MATWTFGGLTPGYYDVYTTWSAQPNASTAASYGVKNNSTTATPVGGGSIASVNQTVAPFSKISPQAFIGTTWAFSTLLTGAAAPAPWRSSAPSGQNCLADAVRLVSEGTSPPTTTLAMDAGGFQIHSARPHQRRL